VSVCRPLQIFVLSLLALERHTAAEPAVAVGLQVEVRGPAAVQERGYQSRSCSPYLPPLPATDPVYVVPTVVGSVQAGEHVGTAGVNCGGGEEVVHPGSTDPDCGILAGTCPALNLLRSAPWVQVWMGGDERRSGLGGGVWIRMRGSPRHVGGGRRFLGDLALSVCRKGLSWNLSMEEEAGVEDEG